MQQPHVPAWKRLGLKLKFAKETSTSSPESANNRASLQNAASGVNGHTIATPPPLKKRRLEESPNGHEATVASISRVLTSSFRDPQRALKKRVSFTQETKESDGDSSKTLMDAWEEQARNDQIDEFLARQAQEADDAREASQGSSTEIPKDQIALPKKAKKSKDSKTTSKLRPEPPRKSRNVLDYLDKHQNSRHTWKFNKNRDTWILKHVLSVDDIPPSHDSSLVEYISGLKSAGARSRLVDQCHDCIGTETEGNKDYEEVRDQLRKGYEASIEDKGISEQLEMTEVERKFRRVSRAIHLLESIQPATSSKIEAPTTPTSLTASSPIQNGVQFNGLGPKKKRKNRTAVVEYSSSSSSSSSDSDSNPSPSSSSGSEPDSHPPRTKRANGTSKTTRASKKILSSDASDENETSSSGED